MIGRPAKRSDDEQPEVAQHAVDVLVAGLHVFLLVSLSNDREHCSDDATWLSLNDSRLRTTAESEAIRRFRRFPSVITQHPRPRRSPGEATPARVALRAGPLPLAGTARRRRSTERARRR